MQTHHHPKALVASVLVGVLAVSLIAYTASASTTVGTDISTSGSLTVGGTAAITGATTLTGALTANGNTTLGDASTDTVTITGATSATGTTTITLPATGRLYIDGTTTANTGTNGVIALDVRGSAGGAIMPGQYISMTDTGINGGAVGQKISINNTSAYTNNNDIVIGNYVDMKGINNASSVGSYYGNLVGISGSSNNAATYIGYEALLNSNLGVNLTGSGTATGFSSHLTRTSGSGEMYGDSATIGNSGTTSGLIYGYYSGINNFVVGQGGATTGSTSGIIGNYNSISNNGTATNITGISLSVTNNGTASNVIGIDSSTSLHATTGSTSNSVYGIWAKGTLQTNNQPGGAIGIQFTDYTASGSSHWNDGILISTINDNAEGQITDGLDVSASSITNAINIGTNTILASGSSTFDLINASNDAFTITNSGAGTSSLLVEGIAKGGYAVINGDTTGTSSVFADVITLTLSSGTNVYGFAPCSDRSITNWAGRELTVLGSTTNGGAATFKSAGPANTADTIWLDTDRTVSSGGRGVLTLVCDGTSWYEKSWNPDE